MFSRLRKRFTYANVALTLALVFAMSGGAFAAGRYLITSTKQISPKVLKALQGKAGPAGAAGVQGPGGAAGSQGSAGPKGDTGAQGPKGETGAKGENGKDGATGFTEMLPKEKTETGDWMLEQQAPGPFTFIGTSISFNIPLEAAPLVHYITVHNLEAVDNHGTFEEVKSTECLGAAAAPSAEPGNLCVYDASNENNVVSSSEAESLQPGICSLGHVKTGGECLITSRGADRSGFGMMAASKAAGNVELWGTWAVTAAE